MHLNSDRQLLVAFWWHFLIICSTAVDGLVSIMRKNPETVMSMFTSAAVAISLSHQFANNHNYHYVVWCLHADIPSMHCNEYNATCVVEKLV